MHFVTLQNAGKRVKQLCLIRRVTQQCVSGQ